MSSKTRFSTTGDYLNMNVRVYTAIYMFHSRAGTNCTREDETGSRALDFTFHDTSLNRYQTDENDNDDRLWQERHVGTH